MFKVETHLSTGLDGKGSVTIRHESGRNMSTITFTDQPGHFILEVRDEELDKLIHVLQTVSGERWQARKQRDGQG